MQSGDVPAGGEDSKSAKPLPWKYILIAAILAAAILGIFFAATSGIFSSPASIADTTASSASTGSGWQPPANPNPGGGWIPPNEPDKPTPTAEITKATTKETASQTPIIIKSYNKNMKMHTVKKLWDINNLPKEIPYKREGIYITNFKIGNGEISGTIENKQCDDYVHGVPIMGFYIRNCKEDGSCRENGNYCFERRTPDSRFQWTGCMQSKDEYGRTKSLVIPHNEKIHFKVEIPIDIEKRAKEKGIHYIRFA